MTVTSAVLFLLFFFLSLSFSICLCNEIFSKYISLIHTGIASFTATVPPISDGGGTSSAAMCLNTFSTIYEGTGGLYLLLGISLKNIQTPEEFKSFLHIQCSQWKNKRWTFFQYLFLWQVQKIFLCNILLFKYSLLYYQDAKSLNIIML